ncbi:hypothetical protein DN53_15575 [Flagellimonas olearia]|uniref:Uncharacterized protein n=1 Tax=Flagellimonas olearia TaxID=552546 RepID=A0A444VJW4_9FLAO|nr:hypothetical protein DN53_15575 [Allomuricauda olearia]
MKCQFYGLFEVRTIYSPIFQFHLQLPLFGFQFRHEKVVLGLCDLVQHDISSLQCVHPFFKLAEFFGQPLLVFKCLLVIIDQGVVYDMGQRFDILFVGHCKPAQYIQKLFMELIGTSVLPAALAPVLVIVQPFFLHDISSVGCSTGRRSDKHFQWQVFVIERIFLRRFA